MSKFIKNKIKKLVEKMSKENAVKIAKENGLEYEVLQSIKHGCTPEEALREWDLIQLSLKNSITSQDIEGTSFLSLTKI